ncbi:MAG: hypothetical protein ACLGJB_25060 [Blastocatellia bacterium]
MSTFEPIERLEEIMTTGANILQGKQVILRAGGYSAPTRIAAPPEAALLTAEAAAAPQVTATFQVTYTGFSNEAMTAFQAAVDVWATALTTDVPIRVDAHWTPLDPGVLGSAGPENVLRDFSGAPQASTWYPVALANAISGGDLTQGAAHISANFNSNFTNWYFGIDGNTPLDRYDLMTVVLHELGHGLGFIGSMDVDNNNGTSGLAGFPIIWDRFIFNTLGQSLLDTTLFPNNSSQLAGQLQSNQLFFRGTNAVFANGNSPVRVYAPTVWEPGSSFSHLDEVTFGSGNPNSLMTPQIGMAESIHAPGPIGMGVLRDLGW